MNEKLPDLELRREGNRKANVLDKKEEINFHKPFGFGLIHACQPYSLDPPAHPSIYPSTHLTSIHSRNIFQAPTVCQAPCLGFTDFSFVLRKPCWFSSRKMVPPACWELICLRIFIHSSFIHSSSRNLWAHPLCQTLWGTRDSFLLLCVYSFNKQCVSI